MKAFLRLLKWGGFSVLALLLALVVINAFDEKLEPATEAYLEPVPETYAPETNVFYALLSLDQAGDGWAEAGIKLKRSLDEQLAAGRSDEDAEKAISAELVRNKIKVLGAADQIGENVSLSDTIERIHSGKLDATRLLAENQVFLTRYQSLYRYEHYANTLPPGWVSTSILSFRVGTQPRNLWLLDLAVRVDSGQFDDAVHRLRDDTIFWRRMMAHSQLTLIDKLVMTAWVRRNFQFASQLTHAYPLTESQLQTLQDMAGPIAPEERSLAGTLQQEARFMLAFTQHIEGQPGWFTQPESEESAWGRVGAWVSDHSAKFFFQRNASANRQIESLQAAVKMDARDCKNYLSDEQIAMAHAGRHWWTYAYDPIGKILSDAGGYMPYHAYSGRMCDLVGIQRVLALQLELRRQKVADADIEAFIRQGGEAYADPFTGQPIQWLPKERSLTFGAVDKQDIKRLPWPI
jgi:hypothetical protein